MKLSAKVMGATLAMALAFPGAALANWPERPIRMLVPFGVGGGADTLARAVSEAVAETLGQRVVVENVTGAGGVVGVTALANAEADGYTFGVINVSTQVVAPVTNPNVTYDPITDFEYVSMLGGAPTVIIVQSASPITTLDELVSAARASDRPFTYGTAGALTMSNLVPTVYFRLNDVPVEHIPYQSGVQALADALAGHISFASITFSSAAPMMAEGVMRGLAISTAERVPAFPDVPTMAEIGYPQLTSLTWFGVGAPAGTNPDYVARMSAAINAALGTEAVSSRLEAEGFVVQIMTPEEFLAYQIAQAETFGPIARDISN
jgi:tripartite-type tricarboxylate transporter receptor subunit TctC